MGMIDYGKELELASILLDCNNTMPISMYY